MDKGNFTISNTRYCITGTDKQGKRFEAIYTTNPQHYNIYRGTLWHVCKQTNKRTKILEYFN